MPTIGRDECEWASRGAALEDVRERADASVFGDPRTWFVAGTGLAVATLVLFVLAFDRQDRQ